MLEAERFHHDLTLSFGMLSYKCKDENDFIKKSMKLINKMMKYDEIDLDDMFLVIRQTRRNFIRR
ncbi:MAG: hypothetical protein ACRDE2_07895 [Chitinophagaceae bacterium]